MLTPPLIKIYNFLNKPNDVALYCKHIYSSYFYESAWNVEGEYLKKIIMDSKFVANFQ